MRTWRGRVELLGIAWSHGGGRASFVKVVVAIEERHGLLRGMGVARAVEVLEQDG
jgi:hypothetical protein